MTLNIGLRRDFKWIFIIAAVPVPIIGADFLRHFSLVVDVKNRKLIDSQTELTVNGNVTSVISPSPVFAMPNSDNAYAALLSQYPDVTRPNYQESSIKHNVTHQIKTTGQPVSARPRRLAANILPAAKAKFDHMLELGIIRPSASQWSSPLHMVLKKKIR